MQLSKWVEDITKRVYCEWESKYSFWKPGFKTFYGPVRQNPKLIILSYNPGGGQYYFKTEDFHRFKNGDFSAPKVNSYIFRKNRMANRVQDLFQDNESILATSVTFPILFFRSKSAKTWRKLKKDTRNEMESLCIDTVNEILEKIKSKGILILGFATYHKLKKNFLKSVTNEQSIYGNNNRRIACLSNWNNVRIFSILHPTGSRISIDDWSKIKSSFNEFLQTL